MKPNIIKITDFIKKQSGWIVAIILALCLFTCNENHSVEIAERDKENKILKSEKIDLVNSGKEKDKIIKANNKDIAENNKKMANLELKIVDLNKKAKKQISKMTSYSINEWKKYYQDVTGFGDKDISVQDSSSLKITRAPLEKIGNYIVTAQVTQSKYKVLSEAYGLLVDNLMLTTENFEIQQRKNEQLLSDALTNEKINQQIQDNLNENIKDLKIDLKKAKRPKLIPIVISVAGGFILGSALTK